MENLRNKALTERIEELFLKIFKVVVLVVMGLGLVLAIGLSLYSASLYFKSPIKSEPVKAAPAEELSVDELLKQLKQDEATKRRKPTTLEPPKAAPYSDAALPVDAAAIAAATAAAAAAAASPTVQQEAAQALIYLEEVTALYKCSIEFRKSVGEQVAETDTAAASKIEEYRSQLETLAVSNERRGDAYLKDAVKFTCSVLKNPQIIALRKDNKLSGVFLKVLNFHLREWDRIQLDKINFEREEEIRVKKEESQREAILIGDKIQAVTMITAAGIAFAIFMIISLYLIFAKIETNLRQIAYNVQELLPNTNK